MGDRSLGDADKDLIEKRIESSIKENQRFERVVVTREEALAMFEENKFKVCDWALGGREAGGEQVRRATGERQRLGFGRTQDHTGVTTIYLAVYCSV